MILCDDQAGSKDLFPYIRKLTGEVLLTRVEPPFGDLVWTGNGPDDRPCMVAVEYKKISEVLDHICGGGRFVAHQVEGLITHYDRRYLLIEGRIRFDRTTNIMQELRRDRWVDVVRNQRGFTFRDFEHWKTTIEEQAQFRTALTWDESESARWIFTKHSWWTNKGWDEHSSLKQFWVPPPPTMLIQKPNLVRRWAKELEGIGWDKSLAVAAHFPTPIDMALADESSWRKIDGIGKQIAANSVMQIRGQR